MRTAVVGSSLRLLAYSAFLLFLQAGCKSDNMFDPDVSPEPAVATTLTAVSSGQMSANVGTSLFPAVRVGDQHGFALAGVTVTFEVASGGGSVIGASVTTNSAGIAIVGRWILGATPGLNTLTASAAGLPSITFVATGTVQVASTCDQGANYPFGTTVTGALAAGDCYSDAVYTDFYSTTLSGAGAYVFRLSAIFDAYLYLGTQGFFNDFEGSFVAGNDNESSATTGSAIKALLPAGSYMLGASSSDWDVTGAYSLSSETASSDVSRCEEVYVVRGLSTAQMIATTDCERTNAPLYADEFLIYLKAGERMSLSMSSTVIDSFVEVVLIDPMTGVRKTVASNDNADTSGTKDARLVYASSFSAFYVVVASTALNAQTGVYTLAVQ